MPPLPEGAVDLGGARKVVVFGATGRTGRLIVERLLAKAWTVTAFVRYASSSIVLPDRFRVIEGAIDREDDVRFAIEGQDAVVSALGPSKQGPSDVLAVAAATIFPAMRDLGVRRYVGVLGATVKCPDDAQPTLGGALVYGLIRVLARRLVMHAQTHLRMAELSGLDWTIVRPPRLTDGPATGVDASVRLTLKATSQMSREDLAEFVVHQIAGTQWVGRAPLVVSRAVRRGS